VFVYLWTRTSPYIPNLWIRIVVCIADYATVSSGKDGRTVNMSAESIVDLDTTECISRHWRFAFGDTSSPDVLTRFIII
jgi:hypothetical protein